MLQRTLDLHEKGNGGRTGQVDRPTRVIPNVSFLQLVDPEDGIVTDKVDLGLRAAGDVVTVLEPKGGDGLVPLHYGAEQGDPLIYR